MLPEEVRDRVIEEQEQLREKITKLAAFVYDFTKIKSVSDYELTLLKRQLAIMEDYDETLTKRLKAD